MTKKKKSARKAARKPARRKAMAARRSAKITDITPFFAGNFAANPAKVESFVNQGKSQFDKLTSDANAFGRDGMEAMNKSMTIFTKGCEEIMRASVSIAQNVAEKQTQLFKDGLSAKTINEWTELQNRIAQANFDDCMSAAAKLSELSVRVLTETAEPFNAQMTKSMKKATEAMAA
jgi:phasin family protein